MKVIVFGANGRVGAQVVKRALEKGHKVTAFVRTSESVSLLHHLLPVLLLAQVLLPPLADLPPEVAP